MLLISPGYVLELAPSNEGAVLKNVPRRENIWDLVPRAAEWFLKSIVSQQFCFHSKDGLCCHGNLITPGSGLSISLSLHAEVTAFYVGFGGFGDLQASTLHLHTRIPFSRQG